MITLDWYEVFVASVVGELRYVMSRLRGLKITRGTSDDVERRDQIAAGAEIAVAKFLGLYWPPSVNTGKAADIPPDIQVRWTSNANGRLIIRPNDPPGKYVLVTGTTPDFEVRGWVSTDTSMQKKYLTDFGNPSAGEVHAVPQTDLRPMSEIA